MPSKERLKRRAKQPDLNDEQNRDQRRVREGNQGIETGRKQRFDFAAMNRFHNLHGRISGLRNLFRRNAPDFCRMGTSFEIADGSLAGKLITLLSVLASALAIALTGDHRAARSFTSDIAGGQTKVDERKAILDALRLVLDAAGVKYDGASSFGEKLRCAFDGFGWHSGFLRGRARIPGVNRFRDLLEAPGVGGDEGRSRLSRKMTCNSPMYKARSVPGRTGRYMSALRQIGVMRGSTIMSFPPASRHRQR
jgi:hypothetical protein